MGGKALGFEATRMTASEYNEFTTYFIDSLYANYDNMQFDVTASYKSKESYGDVDICVMADNHTWDNFVKKMYTLYEHVYCNSGNGRSVMSIGLHGLHGGMYQVDFILTGDNKVSHEMALHYYSNNDLGNLIGKIARHTGFKYGCDGLTYDVYDDQEYAQKVGTIIVSQDITAIYDFLGIYDVVTEFDYLEDIFEYVATSTLFNPTLYYLENLNSTQKIRDKKRTTYQEFLKWLDDPVQVSRFYNITNLDEKQRDIFKKIKYNEAMIVFEDFAINTALVLKKTNYELLTRTFINGDIVTSLTNFHGKMLGSFMKELKNDVVIKRLLLEAIPSQVKINQRILSIAESFKKECYNHINK